MTKSIFNGFLIFAIIQSFFFASLFLSKKNRTSANFTITSLLLLLAVHSFLILVNLNITHKVLFKILPLTLTLLYGPLLLLYVRALRLEISKNNIATLLHFIPFIIYIVLAFSLSNRVDFQKIVSISGAISGLSYCLMTLVSIKKHENKIVELYSTTKRVSLHWLHKLVKGIACIWVCVFVLVFLKQLFHISITLNWFFIPIPFFITYIGYHGLKQQLIFQLVQTDPDSVESDTKKTPSSNDQPSKIDSGYKKSGLTTQDMERIFGTLEMLMKTDKLYVEPNLNLQDLAQKAKVPQHHITQTLNSFAQQNFYDYINSYRVREFIQKLKNGDTDSFSLLGIAFDCGFNSKSSFNRIFKKTTGFSPSEFKKNNS